MRKLLWIVVILLVLVAALNWLCPGCLFQTSVQAGRLAAGLSQKSLTLNGQQFGYLDNQKTQKPVVLEIHGFTGDKDNFTLLNIFMPDYRLISIDLLGHGDSSAPLDGDYRISAQVARVDAFIRELKLTNVHLIGNSMGGHIAAMYAARHPEQVASLTLIDNSGVWSQTPSDVMAEYFETGKVPLILSDYRDLDTLFAYIFVKPPLLTASLKRYYGQQQAAKQTLHTQIFNDFMLQGYEPLDEELGNITAPVQIIWGSDDRVLHPSSIHPLRAALKQVQTTIINHAGHVPMVEKPQLCATIIGNFLQQTTP